MLCAASEGAIPSAFCNGNAGGALVVETGSSSARQRDEDDVLFGTVAWGACNARGFPGVYSSIAAAASWIEDAVCTSDLVLHGAVAAPSSFRCAATTMFARAEKNRIRIYNSRYVQRNSWPHFLILKMRFDSRPSEVSWKFENARTKKVLAGVAFEEYDDETFGNSTIEVPLDILTGEDFEGENDEFFEQNQGNNPLFREYRFVIYDRGGNGLCCNDGDGEYDLYSKNSLVAQGATFGAIDETTFTIDPRVFLGQDYKGGVVNIPVVNVPIGTFPVVDIPSVNVQPSPSSPAAGGNSPSTPADASGETDISGFEPTGDQPRPSPTMPAVAVQPAEPTVVVDATMPSLMSSFYCGTSFPDADKNCHLPCPTGSPTECLDPKLNFLEKKYVCFASTTCHGRTRMPSVRPTRRPSIAIDSSEPVTPTSPTEEVIPANDSKPSTPTSPTEETMWVDSDTWFCGESWDWITENCAEAKPCPGGDAVNCPPNHGCYASTPCTLAPTLTPSSEPSNMPTDEPSPSPTKSPWSEAILNAFINAPNDSSNIGNGGGTNQMTGGQQLPPSSSGDSFAIVDEKLASEVNDALENYSSLQYHFFCGISWTHADETCDVFCPSGDKSDCPDEEECYANTRCDGRDTDPPTTSPVPTTGGTGPTSNAGVTSVTASGSGGEFCAVCEDNTMDPSQSIAFQDRTTTCGNLDQLLSMEEILVGSNTCNSVRDMYRNTCCYDECQLCRTPNGEFLDLRGEYVLKREGYAASCQEISNILITSAQTDTICSDAQAQVGGECCYEQCTLCGGNDSASVDMSTEWYATVTFQGLTTTCLGLDYMLRVEQVMDGSNQCNELQGQYMDRCCYPSDSCQLCRADDKVYDLDPGKIVAVEQSMRESTSCMVISDSLAGVGKNSQECIDGKQDFFGQCCDLSNLLVSGSGISPISSAGGGGEKPNTSLVGAPNSSSVENSNTSPGEGAPSPSLVTTSNQTHNDTLGTDNTGTNTTGTNTTGMSMTPSPTTAYSWDSVPYAGDAWQEGWESRSSGYETTAFSSLVILGLNMFSLSFV